MSPRAAKAAGTDFVAAVAETIARRGMDAFAPGPILAAVSGGADSIAMLHALHRLGYAIEVAHFDHRARPGSGGDAAFVRAQAEKLRLPFHLGAMEDEPARGLSVEDAFRRARLAFLETTASAAGATRIATGHTLDDQAETVLMRMVAGAGRRGLAGIPPVRGPYIRPLIDRTRDETHAFCRALRTAPRHDETNDDASYLRNAIRSDLLPHIAARYNARIAEAMARSADVLREEDALLDELAAAAIEPEAAGGAVRVNAGELTGLHPALARRAIRRIAPLGAQQTERVRRLAASGATGDRIFLGQGLNAWLEYGWLVLGPAPSSPAGEPDGGTGARGSWSATLDVPGETDVQHWNATLRATVITRRPSPLPDGIAACAVDAAVADAADGGLEVRPPKTGDRFRPIGMRGAKKLGDFFTDQKVPRAQRTATPIVASRRGIVWVVGHRIADDAKVTAKTKRVLLLEWEPH